MKKDRAEYLGTLLDNLRIACHLSFHVHLIYACMTFNSPNSDKLLTHATFYPRVNSPTSRTCRSSSSMRKTLLSVFITIYNTYALFRNANIVFNFLSSVGHHFFFHLRWHFPQVKRQFASSITRDIIGSPLSQKARTL